MNYFDQYKLGQFLKSIVILSLLSFAYIQPGHAAPGDILFEDDFETGTLVGKWTINNSGGGDAAVSTNTNVSGSRSMYTRWDEVVVTSIVTSTAVPGAEISLYIRRGLDALQPDSEDPDSGEDLVLEYLDNNNAWIILETFLGSGTKGEILNRTYQLPAEGLHAAFQLRIRQTNGNGATGNGFGDGTVGYDYWHVDDVTVTETVFVDTLVSSYSLDDSSFTTVTDTSGNGFDGAATGNATPSSVNPVVAGSPGTCGYADFADNNSNNTIDAINTGVDVNSIGNRGTITLWYKSNERWNGNNGARMILDASTNIGSGGNRKYFFLMLQNDSQLRFALEDTSDGDYILDTGNNNFAQDVWVHIAITWDMPGDSLQIFINGNLANNSTPNTNGTLASDLGAIFLGDNSSVYQASGSSGNSANGSIDEVYFYSEVRSAAQIQANRDFTRPCATPPLTCGPIPSTYPIYSAGDDLDIDNNVTIDLGSGAIAVEEGDNNGNVIDTTLPADNNVTDATQTLPTIEPPTFPATGSVDVDVTAGTTQTIDVTDNPPGDGTYDNIDVNDNATLNFTGGGPFYIDRLRIEDTATVNFDAGTYFIDQLQVRDDDATINVNGAVRLFIGDHFTTGNNDDRLSVNAGGAVSDLVVFLYPNAEFDMDGEDLDFTGVIYGPNSGDIKIDDNSTITGAIIGGDEVELDDDVSIIYTPAIAAAVASITTCDGATFSHFTLTHDNFGINCLAEPNITVTAIGTDGNPFDADGLQITLDTQSVSAANSIWSKTSAGGTFDPTVATDNIALFTFDPGQSSATFSLLHQQGDASLNLVTYLTASPATTYADPEGNLVFSPNGFTITTSPLADPFLGVLPPLAAQVAGTNVPLYITAYGVTPTDPTCGVIESYAGNKPLQFWFDYNNPNRDSGVNPSINGTGITDDTEANALTLPGGITFTAGRGQVTTKHKDVGLITLGIKDESVINAELPNGIRGTANIIFAPADIVITQVRKPDGTGDHLNVIASTAETDILKAGNDFAVKLEVRDAEDSLTPNFGYETIPEQIEIVSSSLVAPAGRNGSLDDGAIVNKNNFGRLDYDGVTALADGEFLGTEFSFDEVGIIQLQASIDDNDATNDDDYLGGLKSDGTTLAVVGTPSGNVGRFVPDRFAITDNSPTLADSCGAFSYMDQNINFATSPTFTLTALEDGGGTTQNYDIGAFWRYSVDLANRSYTNNAATPATLDSNPLPANISVSGNNDANGVGQLAISNEPLLYQRPADPRDTAGMPPDPAIPFNADIDLDLSVADLTDNDNVCYDSDNDDTCETYSITNITGTQVRFGRLNIDSAFGSELVDLQLPVTAQYYDSLINDFVPATDDTCTVLTDTLNGVLATSYGHFFLDDANAYSGNLDPGETTPSLSAFAAGQATLTMSASRLTGGIPNSGSVLIEVLLNNPAIPLQQPWLQFDWDGNGNHDNDPTATATFGIFRGNDSTIYLRELY